MIAHLFKATLNYLDKLLLEKQWLSLRNLIRLIGLGVAIMSFTVFIEITEEMLEQESDAIDEYLLLLVQQFHYPWLTQIMIAVTFLGQPWVLFVLCLLVVIALAYYQQHLEAWSVMIAAGGVGIINALLKLLFARERPQLWEHAVTVHSYSFPSGHAMGSLVVYGMLGYLLWYYGRRWRWLSLSFIGFLILAIGLSRLYLGVHWPTDVAAGYIAGLVWLIASILSLEVWRDKTRIQPKN